MRRHGKNLFGLSLLTLAIAAAIVLAQQKFQPTVEGIPFARIAEIHDIDRRCPNTGKNDGNIYHYAQNAAKNNFSVRGTPIELTIPDFTRLQQNSQEQINASRIVLQGKYPADRAQLRNLIMVRGKSVGEGTMVSLKAYVFSSEYANTKYNQDAEGRPARGEAVNCDNAELDWNDIHISLSGSANASVDPCSTVTAEISPHYRPALWSKFHDGLNESVQASIPGLLKGKVLDQLAPRRQPVYVRLTGQLFYDASHKPCVFSAGKVTERNSPERRSIWEIHPVYRIEVYDRRTRQWLDLDRWTNSK